MRTVAVILTAIVFPSFCFAGAASEDISPDQLQAIIGLPLKQAVERRETYKTPLKSAYARQIGLSGRDCQEESKAGQRQYNICMGKADEQAGNDFSIFYRNLQMLCHTQDELATLQMMHKTWLLYKDSALKATNAAWPDGSGASGFASQVSLSLLRGHMRELREIYGLNVAQ